MRLVFDELAPVTTLEQRSFPRGVVVEPNRILTLEELHTGREIRVRSLDDQMEMVAHQAVRVQSPAVAHDDDLQKHEKELSIAGDDIENRSLLHPTGRHVVDDVGYLDPRLACYLSKVPPTPPLARSWHSIDSMDRFSQDINRV